MWTILKINSHKVNNGRAEGAISHLPSENLWLSQSAHNYHRALACACATAARCSVFFFFYPYDLTFESFRTAHALSRAAQPRQFIFLSFFSCYFRSGCNFNSDADLDPIHNGSHTSLQASIVELGLCGFASYHPTGVWGVVVPVGVRASTSLPFPSLRQCVYPI